MRALTKRLSRYFLPNILACACESTIPRSGERGEQVNCFVVSIDKNGEPYLIVTGLVEDEMQCIEWDGNHYSLEKNIPLSTLEPSDLYITHYYGLSEIKYFGIIDFAIGRSTRLPYLKIYAVLALSKVDQYFFNKKKLITKQRVDLLKVLVSLSLDGKSTFGPLELMTQLYSIKWVLHPDHEAQHHKLEFYLESLTDTGELKKINHQYTLTGNALRTIEEYEEQERKHTENVKIQRRMLLLTFAIALLTAVQAGLIRLPVFIDLTRKVEIKSMQAISEGSIITSMPTAPAHEVCSVHGRI